MLNDTMTAAPVIIAMEIALQRKGIVEGITRVGRQHMVVIQHLVAGWEVIRKFGRYKATVGLMAALLNAIRFCAVLEIQKKTIAYSTCRLNPCTD